MGKICGFIILCRVFSVEIWLRWRWFLRRHFYATPSSQMAKRGTEKWYFFYITYFDWKLGHKNNLVHYILRGYKTFQTCRLTSTLFQCLPSLGQKLRLTIPICSLSLSSSSSRSPKALVASWLLTFQAVSSFKMTNKSLDSCCRRPCRTDPEQ